MATRYGLQHKTTGRYLDSHPEMGPHSETVDADEAVTWATATEATLMLLGFEDYAGCWQVVPLDRQMMVDLLNDQGAPSE